MPLKRTPTLSHEPVPAPVYADVTVEEARSAEHDAKEANETPAAMARQQAALKSIFSRMRVAPALPSSAGPGLRRCLTVAPPDEPVALPFKSPLERTDPPIPINASVPGLRRTDFDGLVYEPGTTALMPTGLHRSPSVMITHCTGCGTESTTLCNKCNK